MLSCNCKHLSIVAAGMKHLHFTCCDGNHQLLALPELYEQPNAIASAKYLLKNKFKASNSDEYNITKKTFLVSLPKIACTLYSVTPTIKVVVYSPAERGWDKVLSPLSSSVSLYNLVEREGLYTPKQREGRKRERGSKGHGLAFSVGEHTVF